MKNKIFVTSTLVAVSLCALAILNVSNAGDIPLDYTVPVASDEIKIMTYNVENFFDTTHDAGKDDYEYLPKSDPEKINCNKNTSPSLRESCLNTDWTPARFDLKLQQVKKAVDAQGVLPDLLALEEIENQYVVHHIAQVLGYDKFVMTTGEDERGINVALLYREDKLTLLSSREIKLRYDQPDFAAKPTRNLLLAYFNIKGADTTKVLGVSVNHWPSQASPAPKRLLTAQQLQAALDQDFEKFGAENLSVIALGDFNTISDDDPHPLQQGLSSRLWKNYLLDVHTLYRTMAYRNDPQKMKARMPVGTYFFGPDFSWNLLDHIFISQSLAQKGGILEAELESYRIVAASFLGTEYVDNNKFSPSFGSTIKGVPKAYNHNADTAETAGYSDHYPVVFKVRIKKI